MLLSKFFYVIYHFLVIIDIPLPYTVTPYHYEIVIERPLDLSNLWDGNNRLLLWFFVWY